MSLFSGRKERPHDPKGGYLRYFGLQQWYSDLSEDERQLLNGACPDILDESILETSQSPGSFIRRCAEQVASADVNFAERLFDLAEQLDENPIDVHFTLMNAAEFHRRHTQHAKKWHGTIERDVALLPAFAKAWRKEHGRELPGYPALESQIQTMQARGELPEALELCRHALSLGIAGNWEERIRQMETKIRD